MKADLILEDGTIFSGDCFGSQREVICEMVFNTGLTGYLELLTDASYAGQGLIMAAPLIGNYGVFTEHSEARRPWADALIVRDLSKVIDDERNAEDLDKYLRRYNIPALTNVDTRSLTLHLREHGTMRGMITDGPEYDLTDFLARIRQYNNRSPVAKVSSRTSRIYPAGAIGRQARQAGSPRPAYDMVEFPYQINQKIKPGSEIALLDFGYKQNMVWCLTRRGCQVTVYPWDTPASQILAKNPSGIVLSNGPGDPVDCTPVLDTMKALYSENIPILAICLGHQLLGLATGAKTSKLKYGHRGINHPVKDLHNNRIMITSQNHGYVIMEETINPAIAAISHVHVNDGSVEGLRYIGKPIISVQYHPEGAPGPLDSDYLFDDFLALMASGKE